MRLLEDDLQVSLFARHGRGMTLTEAGVLLLSRATDILRAVDDTRSDLIDQDQSVRGSISLGVPPTVGDVLAARLIEKYHRRYPAVSVRVVPAFSGYLQDFLHRGEVDLAVTYEVTHRLNLNLTPLIVEDLHLVGPPGSGLTASRPVAFEGASKRTLILPGPQHGLRVLISKQARANGLVLHVPIEADALQTLKDLVIRGLGHTILPLASVHAEVRAGQLSSAPITSPKLSRKLMLAQPLGRPVTNAVRLFAEMLRSEITEMVEEHAWDGQLAR
jgi:LysR family nitrogen assimilation transcriptional regulator